MVIGEVVGRLWASRQAETLSGQKLLLVRPLGARSRGARLIVARGSRVRDVTVGAGVADKDVVVGIVDGASQAVGGKGAA